MNGLDLFDSSSIVIAAVVALLSMLVSFVLLASINERKRTRYDQERARVELSAIRDDLEKRMYELNDKILSSDIRFRDVNHLLMERLENVQSSRSSRQNIDSYFLESLGIDSKSLKTDRNKVFVLTPFNDRFEKSYLSIKNVCSELGVRAIRGDEHYQSSSILRHIVREILTSKFVIANLDGRNPNVFYELGIAQALGLPTIMIASARAEIAFDLSNQRIVLWNSEQELKDGLLKAIAKLNLDQRVYE